MENSDFMEVFNQAGGDILQESLQLLLNRDDIDLKTEINNPRAIATLQTIAHVLEDIEFINSSKSLSLYIDYFLGDMLSHKRKSRKEFIDAFRSITDKITDFSLSDKLTKNMKE